jgi:release factor glutamine methyltransferase
MSEDEIILTHILQCRAIDLVVNKPAVTPSQQEQFREYKRRRLNGEPLQYILGTCNFMGLELAVDPSVLVPRPETEQLVDAAIKHIKGDTIKCPLILDLGTGSGCISIALAKFVPQAKIVSIDISVNALEVARANAKRHGVEECIQFIQDDFLTSLPTGRSPWASACNSKVFDLIISNPPYIPSSQMKDLPRDVQHEPALALDGGEDGLKFSRIIIKYTPSLLRNGACLMMEFGDGQAEELIISAESHFAKIEIMLDLAGRERIFKAIL